MKTRQEMKCYILTPRAKRDRNDIWDYIASDIAAADRVLVLYALESP
jgi:plasmid stabilization system protein ParE